MFGSHPLTELSSNWICCLDSKRVITLALDSSEFKKTSTSSEVKFEIEDH